MRKTIIALALAAAALLPVASKAQFRYGPMVGISVSDLKFKQNLISVDKTIGYSGGIVAEMMFPGIGFGIDLGLYYERRGAKLNLGEKKSLGSAKLRNRKPRATLCSTPLAP